MMPKRAERKLKGTAAARGYKGERRKRYVYGTLQKIKKAQRRKGRK